MAELPGIRRVEMIMGMPIVIDVRDDGAGDELLDLAYDWFREVDAVFSTYKDDSEISRLNRGELALRECREDVRRVIARCRELVDETEGYFDAEAVVPGSIDPSGLVKGWSVDRAADLLDEAGARNYVVNAGGDMRLRGAAVPAPLWRVGIQHPQIRDKIAAVVEATDLAVATSGAYIRGDHVVDPHTGRAPRGPALGDDHRPRPRHGRRVRDGRVRDGLGRPGVDAPARALRGDVDHRRRPRAVDAGLSARPGRRARPT